MSDEFRRAASKFLTGDQLERADREARMAQHREEQQEDRNREEFNRYWDSVYPKDTSECTDHS